jgi:membrane-associated phospholipid phosphatase
MKYFFVAAFLLGSLLPSFAQKKSSNDCKMCEREDHVHESPYEISFKKDWAFVLTGTALAATGYFVFENDEVTPFTPLEVMALDRNDVNAFDRVAIDNRSESAIKASDALLIGSVVVLPSLFFLHHHTRQEVGGLFLMTYEAFSINYGLTNIVKSAVNRTRPYAYNNSYTYEERTDRESRFSYFSGHTSATASLSFLWAKVMTDYHPNMAKGFKIGIWSFAALIPATTGYLRVKAGKHYPTDVLTGYAVGAVTGWLIPEMHKIKNPNVNIFTSELFDVKTIGFSLKF